MPVGIELMGTVTKSVPNNEYRQGHIYVDADGATYYIPANNVRSRIWPKVGDLVRFIGAPHRPGFNAEVIGSRVMA